MSRETPKSLDLITIGRSSVDLYGAQIGGRLEDMRSFQKYIGGSPTNIAAGSARLGLRAALISAVGDEHMGRFIREELAREGVDTRGLKTDPDRLTALAILGIRSRESFPLVFYRENCADMGLTEADIDQDLIAQARAVVVTGTHLSHPDTRAAVFKALRIARQTGARTALDIDFRPNLWGLASHGDGENRYVASDAVTERLQETLGLFDLIVGTEEEFHIAGGSTDTLAALKAVRARTAAVLVCKRGGAGAVVFTADIPATLAGGQTGPGFAIEVFNVLGAGDGFMAGLMKGWLEDADWPTALRYANACGALAVSRHGCTPAYPSKTELEQFLARGVTQPALRKDAQLEQVHWATNRSPKTLSPRILAFDHRAQFEALAHDRPHDIARFKTLCLRACLNVADDREGFGILCDSRLGNDALVEAAGKGLWIGRPVELPGSRPLETEPEIGPDFGGLQEWPRDHVVKVLCQYHPNDPPGLKAQQDDTVLRLFSAARRNGLEFLLEIISSPVGPVDERTVAGLMQHFYDIGIFPDWWKLEPAENSATWQAVSKVIERNDPHCRGILLLGLNASLDALTASFAIAAPHERIKGFAIGRTIFQETAEAYLAGTISDADATARMQSNFAAICNAWDAAKAPAATDGP